MIGQVVQVKTLKDCTEQDKPILPKGQYEAIIYVMDCKGCSAKFQISHGEHRYIFEPEDITVLP